MTNQTLHERFKIKEANAAIASRIIKDRLEAKLIEDDDLEICKVYAILVIIYLTS